MDDSQISLTMILRISDLKNSLLMMLPEASHFNIGLKYKFLDKNLYANEFLQKLLSNVPQF